MATNSGEQPGIVGPGSFPIRKPTEASLNHGRMANPPRYLEFGGLDKPSKWYGNANTSNQGPDTAMAVLERGGPTGVKAAVDTSERGGV
jgi:hypothetical protein